jgi:cytochrome bd-type quinol oxidase subunit 2
MAKLAVVLAFLASFAWVVLPTYSSGQTLLQVNGPRVLIVLLIPVVLSIWGLFLDGRERVTGGLLLLFSVAVFFLSGILMGLSYLPSALVLLIPPMWRVHRRI